MLGSEHLPHGRAGVSGPWTVWTARSVGHGSRGRGLIPPNFVWVVVRGEAGGPQAGGPFLQP